MPCWNGLGNCTETGHDGKRSSFKVQVIAIPCLLAVLGIMVLMKFYPTHKTHQILTFLGLFFLVGVVVYLQFLSQDKFFGQDVSDEQIMAFIAGLKAVPVRRVGISPRGIIQIRQRRVAVSKN